MLLNANPLARRLMAAFQPLARHSLNLPAAAATDTLLGPAMAGAFLPLRPSLSGGNLTGRAVAFGILACSFRVLMGVPSAWVRFKLPAATHLHRLAAGLAKMLAMRLLCALALRKFA